MSENTESMDDFMMMKTEVKRLSKVLSLFKEKCCPDCNAEIVDDFVSTVIHAIDLKVDRLEHVQEVLSNLPCEDCEEDRAHEIKSLNYRVKQFNALRDVLDEFASNQDLPDFDDEPEPKPEQKPEPKPEPKPVKVKKAKAKPKVKKD